MWGCGDIIWSDGTEVLELWIEQLNTLLAIEIDFFEKEKHFKKKKSGAYPRKWKVVGCPEKTVIIISGSENNKKNRND